MRPIMQVAVAVSAALLASKAVIAQPAGLTAKADAIVSAAYPADGPGVQVVVMRGGRTIYSSARGLADVASRRPVSSDSVFRLGSITKQFTAAYILRLVQERRIALDDPISRFIPDYPQPGASATIRQLLNHTSGIPSYNDIPGWLVEANTGRRYTTGQLTDVFRDLPTGSAPGRNWAYSNSGYVLLGAVIEAVTRRPWHRAIIEGMVRPLGVRSVTYSVASGAARTYARGYTLDSVGGVMPARRTDASVTHAAAGLVGTAGGLAEWVSALHHARVVDKPLYEQMIAPTKLAEGRAAPYGFGLAFGEVRGRRAIRHDGRIAGFSNESIYLPDADVVVVVLTNSDTPATSPSLVGRRLAALAVGAPYRQFTRTAPDAQSLAPLLGVYRAGASAASRRLTSRAGKIYIAREGTPEREVFAAGENHFFYPDSFSWFRIAPGSGGTQVMHFHQDDAAQAELAAKVDNVAPG